MKKRDKETPLKFLPGQTASILQAAMQVARNPCQGMPRCTELRASLKRLRAGENTRLKIKREQE